MEGTAVVRVHLLLYTYQPTPYTYRVYYRYNDGQRFKVDWYVFGSRQVIYRHCRLWALAGWLTTHGELPGWPHPGPCAGEGGRVRCGGRAAESCGLLVPGTLNTSWIELHTFCAYIGTTVCVVHEWYQSWELLLELCNSASSSSLR